jgi:hypothetical protein
MVFFIRFPCLFFPALFLMDFHFEVYVWEGWIPENDVDCLTGTGKQRWDNDRRLAMETAIKYAEGKSSCYSRWEVREAEL